LGGSETTRGDENPPKSWEKLGKATQSWEIHQKVVKVDPTVGQEGPFYVDHLGILEKPDQSDPILGIPPLWVTFGPLLHHFSLWTRQFL